MMRADRARRLVQGTGSGVGKSVLTTALCRLLSRAGYRVAPFKAQNMSLNACVADGGEIGRAQAAQAEAAGIRPTVDMNPVLLKPETDRSSQVVVRGAVWGRADFQEYVRMRSAIWPVVVESLDHLRCRHDLVIIEGAGSPAEINLRENDIAQGLGHAIGAAAASGQPILGVCGGYQMLGRVVRDPDHVESSIEETPGLGLLPVETTFARDKTVVRVEATGATTSRLFGGVSGTFEAYEIHAGRTRATEMSQHTGATRPVVRLVSREGRAVADVDGAVGRGGNVEGTYLHGVFVDPQVRRCLLAGLAERKGVAADRRWGEPPAVDRYDRLAAIVGGAIDVPAIAKLVGLSCPRSAS